ncbi:MAG: class I SAM-dependent methyltransferase [Oligoflexus sp.]|nr:class I SAM-dependent methyltransferase [Oligoflexus sp.]
MNKPKTVNHEEISVARKALENRYLSVREERRTPESECFVEMNDSKFPVFDYSSFGFAVKSASDIAKSGITECSFVYGDLIHKGLLCQISYSRNLDKGEFIVGFEILESSIDVDSICAYQLSIDIQPEIEEIIRGDTTVPSAFRFLTLDFKDKIHLIRERINSQAELLYRRDNVEFSQRAEDAFSKFFAIRLKEIFEGCSDELEKTLSGQSEETISASKAYFRDELADYIFSAPFVARAFKKPFGYAGDFELMNHIYNNEPIGTNLFGKCLHRAMLEAPASVAVRNRAHFLHTWLADYIEKSPSKPLRILSVASGPARELQLLIENDHEKLGNVEFYLLDQDMKALRQARQDLQRLARKKGLKDPVKYINQAIRNIIEEGLEGEKFDLIYSAGLFDYFADPVAQAAAQKLYDGLKDDGCLIIGNFSSYNPTKFMMELLGDWYLRHRSEEKLVKMFSSISSKIKVESEPAGINLFTVIKK